MDNLTVEDAKEKIICKIRSISPIGWFAGGLFKALTNHRASIFIQTLSVVTCLFVCWKAVRIDGKKTFYLAAYALYVTILHKDIFIINMSIYIMKSLGKRSYLKVSDGSFAIGYPSLYKIFSPLLIVGDIGIGIIIGALSVKHNRKVIIHASNNTKESVINILILLLIEAIFFVIINSLQFEICTLNMIRLESTAIYVAIVIFYIQPMLMTVFS